MDSSAPKQRTSIADIPIANERLYKETAKMTKITPTEVKDIIEFVGSYVHDTIARKEMEAVMIPYFGKFKPKTKKLFASQAAKASVRSGHELIYRALKGLDPTKTPKPRKKS